MNLSKIQSFIIAGIILVMILFAEFHNDTYAPANTKTVQNTVVETPETLDLNLTYQNFRNNYNMTVAKHWTTKSSLNDVYWKEKSNLDTFYCDLGCTVVISGDIDKKTGNLININVGCEPERAVREKDAVARCAMVYTMAIMSLNTKLSRDDADAIVKKLCSNLKNSSTIKDETKYQSKIYNNILMLSAKHKDL